MVSPVLEIDLPGISKWRHGKVREVFDLGDTLLLVATDRISAFDCILPNGIPLKGEVLTQISHFWFDQTGKTVVNHRLSRSADAWPEVLKPYRDLLELRSMWVRKTNPLPIECVVRGYLAGSGWKEYCASQTICGVQLPKGLEQCAALPEPIFTPATKAETGHDENISFERAAELVGQSIANQVREISIALYQQAHAYARERGILIADTKFEFGITPEGQIILIDEVLTPDSSRFWPLDQYQPGRDQPSFDKQFVRNYLLGLDWDRTPPAPGLPDAIVQQTQAKYLEAFERLTGRPLRA